MVYQLAGDPSTTIEDDPSCVDCPTQQEVDDRVYCTCRCRAPEGVDTPTCECAEGFTCTDILELGGDGIRGGYCVVSSTVDEG